MEKDKLDGNVLLDSIASGRVFIVAEIGKNFIQTEDERPTTEYLENAKALVRAAKESGADAVKFQTHNVEDEVLNLDFDSPHFKGQSRYKWVKKNMDSTPIESFWKPLKEYCEGIGITFFSTPMSRGAAIKLEKLGIPFWKVASSDILDFPMLDFMISTGKMIILPTGMSTHEDLNISLEFLKRKAGKIILLHAISRYPYPAKDSNLATISFFKKHYPGIMVGFSQNSPWIEPAVMAAAMGISVLEQHFTFKRDLWGPDHKVSMVPEEFSKMSRAIRELEENSAKREEILKNPSMQKYLGSENKFLQEGEAAFRPLFRKALMAGSNIKKSSILKAESIYSMRPQEYAGGLPSEKFEYVLGKKLTKDLKKFDPITEEVFV